MDEYTLAKTEKLLMSQVETYPIGSGQTTIERGQLLVKYEIDPALRRQQWIETGEVIAPYITLMLALDTPKKREIVWDAGWTDAGVVTLPPRHRELTEDEAWAYIEASLNRWKKKE